jgi:hypothetical protein
MPSIGTYGSTIAPQTPWNVLPVPGDDITLDWMDMVAQFSQRYMKIATYIGTINDKSSFVFQYGSLKCDFHPPILHSYYYDTSCNGWCVYITNGVEVITIGSYSPRQTSFSDVGLNCATFNNYSGGSHAFLLIAYM